MENMLVPQNNDPTKLSKTSLTLSEAALATEMNLTAQNAKTIPDDCLVREFFRVFEIHPPMAITFAFRAWRDSSPHFPSMSDIRILINQWHAKQRQLAHEEKQKVEEAAVREAREQGKCVDFAEIKKQLLNICKMPEVKTQPKVVNAIRAIRPILPTLQLTNEQIEARREMERAEIEHYKAIEKQSNGDYGK